MNELTWWQDVPSNTDIFYHPRVPQPLRNRHHEGMAEYGPSIMARVAVHNPLPFRFTEAMA